MDSEMRKIYTIIAMVMTVFGVLIFSFTGNDYLKIMLFIFSLIGVVLAFLGGILLSWGKSYGAEKFFTSLLILLIIPLASASFLHYCVLIPLKKQGILTALNSIGIVSFLIVLFIYLKYYEKYKWKTYYLQEEKDLGIEIIAIKLLFSKNINPYTYMKHFMSKSYIFNSNRVNEKKRYWDNREYQFLGIPNGLEITYYSKKEQQLFKGEFSFSKQKIKSLMRFGFLFPLIRFQKYNHINLIFFTKGEIHLQLGNTNNDVVFFEGTCKPITTAEIPKLKDNTKTDFTALKTTKYTNADLNLVRKQKVHIKHSITGLTDNIISVQVICANGERYTLTKKFWKGKKLLKTYAPIVVIRFLIVNNKNQHLNWQYTFDINDIASHFKNTKTNTSNNLDYKFHLYTGENNLLKATSFEYINGQKNEFKLDMEKTKIEVLKPIPELI